MTPPPVLGHYRIDEEIGSGSMGAVYRAIDTRLNRAVAIKFWRYDGSSLHPGKRMLKEARAASALNHPNIVIVHDFGETDDGDAFIVQEYIEGRTLRDLLGDKIPLADVLSIVSQVARALTTAHTLGVVHRDIKPENIMVRADGYVKVLDFGIAHLPEIFNSSEGSGTALETLANSMVGTPAYMAPETMLGGIIGPPADVFALGIILYEMLSGQLPFKAATAMGIMTKIASEMPLSLIMLDPSIPAGLDALVMSMLDKTPERRPTAAQVERGLPAAAAAVEPEIVAQPDAIAFTVGREAQLAQLESMYARVRAGRSAFVGIAGEPGIGKTTLLEAFINQVQRVAERPIVVRVRCSESLAGNEAYLPVLEALDSLRSRGHTSLDNLMRSVAPTWHAQVATNTDAVTAANARSAQSQERLKRELRAFLAEASKQAPLVWMIEDLHWADVSTVDILNYVAGRFEDMRVMIVAAFRLSDMTLAKHPFLAVRADLQTKGVYFEIPLALLSEEDIASYLVLRFPGNDFPASFVADIHSRTEGSPLFMADLVRYLKDTGGVVHENGTWKVAKTLADMKRELPESVKGMIARKIERVTDDERKSLLAASVQGQEFDAAPVSAALGIDLLELEEQLEELQAVHGLVQRAEEVEYPDGTLTLRNRFVHVLYQNVLYGTLPPTRRVHLSAKTAEALASHYGTDAGAVSGRLAMLFETARDFASAAKYFHIAAERAISLSAFRETMSLTQRGLENVAKMPDGPARKQLELGLQMSLALSQRMLIGWVAAELEPTLARARQLCHELQDPLELFPVLYNLAFFHMIRGNFAVTREHLTDLKAKAAASGNPDFVMAAEHLLGVTDEFEGNVRDSSAVLEHSVGLHDPARGPEYRRIFGVDPGMQARSMSSRPMWALGYPDRALERARETVSVAEGQRQPLVFVFANLVLQGIHVYRREAEEAIALGDKIIAWCDEYSFPQERAWSLGFQGAAFSLAGNSERGTLQLKETLDTLRELRSGFVRTMFISLHAEALCTAGRVDEGLATVDDGFAYAERTGEYGFTHELHRVRGELRVRQNRLTEAEESLRAAVAYARDRDAKSFELRAATGLARLLVKTGRAAEARAVLEPVYNWFTEGQGTLDLVVARTLLNELHGH
jgi:hypothetical protein